MSRLRRYTIRLDGFVSLHGHSLARKRRRNRSRLPETLSVNYSTSAVGSLRIEIQDADGQPIDGFALSDSAEMFGDSTEQEAMVSGP